MNHLKWMGHSSTIMDIQRDLRNDIETCEVTLVARDGISVRAHLFVLSTCSDLMRNLLMDVPRGHQATIVIPDIRGELLESMLAFIYMGETSLPSVCLTEFLEAINLLGIKSAISFECNTTAMQSTSSNLVAGNMAVEAAKSISGLQIAHAEMLQEEEEELPGGTLVAKLDQCNSGTVTVVADQQQQNQQGSRSLEFLDVYGDQPKITYSIEHMSGTTSGNQYILTENTGTFTITQSAATPLSKLEATVAGHEVVEAHVSDACLVDEEVDGDGDVADEVDESQLIEEEYVASNDPLLEMGTDVEMNEDDAMHDVVGVGDVDPEDEDEDFLHEKMPRKIIELKARTRRIPATTKVMKRPAMKQQQQQQQQYTALKSELKNGTHDALELAAEAVLQEGLSLQKAADRFDISKTVLWRRVRTNPEYMKHNREKPSLSEAYERLKNGDSLKSISQDLQIPMSTLHRHKVRLAAEGRLPDFVSCRRRDSTPKDELRDKLTKAVHACLNEGMSQNHAANLFEIPKSTLWRHLQRRVAEADQKVKQEQDDEEEILT